MWLKKVKEYFPRLLVNTFLLFQPPLLLLSIRSCSRKRHLYIKYYYMSDMRPNPSIQNGAEFKTSCDKNYTFSKLGAVVYIVKFTHWSLVVEVLKTTILLLVSRKRG